MATTTQWIDNAPYESKTINSLSHPNDSSLPQTQAHSASEEDVEKAISSAQAAFPGWAATPATKRREILLNAARILRSKETELVKAWQIQMDVEDGFAAFNVMTSAGMIEEIAAGITTAMSGDIPATNTFGNTITMVTREPLGVTLALCPFNAALILSIRGIATPLAAGNTVIAKISEIVPATQSLWGPIFQEAGLPPGCLNILHTSRSDTPARTAQLIADRRVRHVSFTGSSGVGRVIGRLAGENLKPCILELGGKSPVLVLGDADVEMAANNVLFHAFLNAGQICMSTERVLVSPSLLPSFLTSIRAQHVPGKTCKLASLIAAKRLVELVNESLAAGATLVVGSDVWPPSEEQLGRGVVPAVVLTDIDPSSMRIWHEETFGPVCIIVSPPPTSSESTESDDSLITLANDSSYGLAASIYSSNAARALAVGRKLEAGMVRINSGTVDDDPTVPFGGYKDTGFGRFNGVEAIRAYTQTKAMSLPLGGPHMLPLH